MSYWFWSADRVRSTEIVNLKYDEFCLFKLCDDYKHTYGDSLCIAIYWESVDTRMNMIEVTLDYYATDWWEPNAWSAI